MLICQYFLGFQMLFDLFKLFSSLPLNYCIYG
jgi:hypothetical protein